MLGFERRTQPWEQRFSISKSGTLMNRLPSHADPRVPWILTDESSDLRVVVSGPAVAEDPLAAQPSVLNSALSGPPWLRSELHLDTNPVSRPRRLRKLALLDLIPQTRGNLAFWAYESTLHVTVLNQLEGKCEGSQVASLLRFHTVIHCCTIVLREVGGERTVIGQPCLGP